MHKMLSLALLIMLTASSLVVVQSVSAQSLKPVVTDFSLQYVDNSYDVPASTKATKDLYTGEVTTTIIPGYHVENKSIVATIKNPSGVTAYNFRWKERDSNSWFYCPFDVAGANPPLYASDSYGVPTQASSSEYTTIPLTFISKLMTTVDVQVQALYGNYRAEPYVHVQPLPGGATYDFYFDGQASYWSSTQTITTGNEEGITPSQAPTVPPSVSPSETPTATPLQPDVQASAVLGVDWWQLATVALAVAVLVLVAALLFQRGKSAKVGVGYA